MYAELCVCIKYIYIYMYIYIYIYIWVVVGTWGCLSRGSAVIWLFTSSAEPVSIQTMYSNITTITIQTPELHTSSPTHDGRQSLFDIRVRWSLFDTRFTGLLVAAGTSPWWSCWALALVHALVQQVLATSSRQRGIAATSLARQRDVSMALDPCIQMPLHSPHWHHSHLSMCGVYPMLQAHSPHDLRNDARVSRCTPWIHICGVCDSNTRSRHAAWMRDTCRTVCSLQGWVRQSTYTAHTIGLNINDDTLIVIDIIVLMSMVTMVLTHLICYCRSACQH
jgi:hypothetical protein